MEVGETIFCCAHCAGHETAEVVADRAGDGCTVKCRHPSVSRKPPSYTTA